MNLGTLKCLTYHFLERAVKVLSKQIIGRTLILLLIAGCNHKVELSAKSSHVFKVNYYAKY